MQQCKCGMAIHLFITISKRLTITTECKRKLQGNSAPNVNQDISIQGVLSSSVQNVVLIEQLKEGHAGSRAIAMQRKEEIQWVKEAEDGGVV